MRKAFRLMFLLPAFFICSESMAQKRSAINNLVYVDKTGVLRYTKNKTEASFFGVNYTVPFAYSYRAHKALKLELEKAIRQDVYHLARLGLDAFRVHVWDTEISDAAGNLLENEHLRLFDYLLAELNKRNIRIIITPIAFWGNGYPEKDEITPGFSRVFGRGKLTTNDTAIRAQENYLRQFFTHVNPYTKFTYVNDPGVIAVELNNEPSHSGPKTGVTDYINRLAAAVRSTGFTKPLYYNISQSPYYADAVAKSSVDGFSFQWYPTGLVSNQEVKGNFLPNVDHYSIPYDTIPEYKNRSLMVYEFDAADVLKSYMYPAMAKSFREAGFQWATQFAYDPMALAYANTEYQTHYLNLAYTPSKAISLMIASEVFHKLPVLKKFGSYPVDSVFDVFRISYRTGLSEMNTDQKFYYTNNTETMPANSSRLMAVAGVGSSSLVRYEGSGAYFLDKVDAGSWRLEVMPDAIHIRDPFEKASPKKEVTRIQWETHQMRIILPDLGAGFDIKALDEGNTFSTKSTGESFQIRPGTYLLTRSGKSISSYPNSIGVIGLKEFVAPANSSAEMFLRHEPYGEVSAGKSFTVHAEVAGIDTGRLTLQLSRLDGYGVIGRGQSVNILMTRKTTTDYEAEVPAALVSPGILNYKIVMQKGNEFASFPGNFKVDPANWNNINNETWKTLVAPENGELEIFNPAIDRNALIYPGFGRNFQSSFITGEKAGQVILRLAATQLSGEHTIGFQYFFADKLKGRITESASFNKLLINARTSETTAVKAKIILTNADGISVAAFIELTNNFQDIEVPLDYLMPDAALLMPRPYPGFMALQFKGAGSIKAFKLSDMEKIEITIGPGIPPAEFTKPYSMEIGSIRFQKRVNNF